MMSEIVYQYQQAYVPNNGNTFHFWVDCTKEIHDEEAREGGTVRTLYTAPPAPVLRPIELPEALLPANHKSGEAFMAADSQGNYINREFTIKAIRAAGYEVKE